jgi:putative heme-binding domain-containing protein
LAEFLEAVARGDLPASDLEPGRLRLLEQHKDQRVAGLVGRLKQKLKLGQRDEVLAAYQAALKLKGNAEAGKKHFQKICAACHRLQNVGHEIGPNLATLQNRGPESILLNVLDPNREVNPQYVNYVVMTTQGRSVTGMIAAETATSVTLRRKENETDTILRSQIEEIRGTGLSIMPEGLEKELDQQAMADLIAYLMSLN